MASNCPIGRACGIAGRPRGYHRYRKQPLLLAECCRGQQPQPSKMLRLLSRMAAQQISLTQRISAAFVQRVAAQSPQLTLSHALLTVLANSLYALKVLARRPFSRFLTLFSRFWRRTLCTSKRCCKKAISANVDGQENLAGDKRNPKP